MYVQQPCYKRPVLYVETLYVERLYVETLYVKRLYVETENETENENLSKKQFFWTFSESLT